MKRSTLFAVLAVVLIMSATVVVLADISHSGDTVVLGTKGTIAGTEDGGVKFVTVEAGTSYLHGTLIEESESRAKVAAHNGGSANLEADNGAALWVVGGTTGNHGDVIVVLGN